MHSDLRRTHPTTVENGQLAKLHNISWVHLWVPDDPLHVVHHQLHKQGDLSDRGHHELSGGLGVCFDLC